MRYLTQAIITLFLLSHLGCSAKTNDIEFYKEAILRGNRIVAAIENYKEKNGFYPSNIEKLVPSFLQAIPNTGIEDVEFSYLKTENANEYQLTSIVEPSGFALLGSKSIKWLIYTSDQKYENNKFTKNHFIYGNWALQTRMREYKPRK